MRVRTKVEDQRETPIREKLPPNQIARVQRAEFVEETRPAFVNSSGENVPERTNTVALLECVLPEGAEPTKVYAVSLGCGDKFKPGPNGAYLEFNGDDPKDAALNVRSGFATFLRSLVSAGAENGLYGAKEEALVDEDIHNLEGMEFHTGVLLKDGGPRIGKYEALIATQVYKFGK